MLNDNRQQYVIQSNDPKGDEGFGKFFGALIVFVMFLGFVQTAYESLVVWFCKTVTWLNEAATYLANFLGF